MKQLAFEARHASRWARFDELVQELETLRRKRAEGEERAELAGFPALYLEICHDLAVATERRYSPRLIDRLNRMTLAGHRVLYTRDLDLAARAVALLGTGFPKRLRCEWRSLGVATALFLVPGLAIAALVAVSPELIYSVMSPDQIRDFEAMYDPASPHIGEERGSAGDIQMFGFYIRNNIGIAFRAFAGGVLLGIGSIVVLVLNGLLLGSVAAHIVHLGFERTFFSFVIGHGAFELTAIVIAGAAGLKLGWAILAPGAETRLAALQRSARESIELVYGVFVMLVLAALLEAFWSSKATVPAELKLSVGAVLWAVVFLYFVFAGRSRRGVRGSRGA